MVVVDGDGIGEWVGEWCWGRGWGWGVGIKGEMVNLLLPPMKCLVISHNLILHLEHTKH